MFFKSLVSTAVAVGVASAFTCDTIYSDLQLFDIDATVNSCSYVSAGTNVNITGGQSVCTTSYATEVDICRVVLSIKTGVYSETYTEIWLPTGTAWNGRLMGTDNGGLGGCIPYEDLAYATGMGFAAAGDNVGHNNTVFDGRGFLNNNDVVVDFSHRSKHATIMAAKQVAHQYYNSAPSYSYFMGCSTGGRQALKAAQAYPDDFDGILAGSPAADFNHLGDWTGRFLLITQGVQQLSNDQWVFVNKEIMRQCDEPLDGVADGILEDPTICDFNKTTLSCDTNNDSRCLTHAQLKTIDDVYSELYDQQGNLLYPSLALGAELKASQQGLFSGNVQAASADWFKYAVYNDSNWSPYSLDQASYDLNTETDVLHGNISTFEGDLAEFRSTGAKLLMYHGMEDPNISGENSQRYYLEVARAMGATNDELDEFFRFFRISGGGHCNTGGTGAWQFGQFGQAKAAGDNVIWDLVNWVEKGQAPETITGTKFNNDDPNQGIAFERPHCRFPYRTTYDGVGDSTKASSWSCKYIDNWQECGPGALPRLC